MISIWKFLFLLFLLFAVQLTQGQDTGIDSVTSAIDQNGHLTGVLLVAQEGKITYLKSFGFADRIRKIRNQTDTKFLIGSLTKQFTAMLIMQQVESGRLSLDERIISYLPDYRKDTGSKITVRHLLTHTHGIPNPELTERHKPIGKKEFMKTHCEGNLNFEPGSDFEYSNVAGYYLLGIILENVTGKPFDILLTENILAPLKMINTGYFDEGNIPANMASGYIEREGNFELAPRWHMSQSFSAAGMYSTAGDLLLWDRALRRETLVSQQSLDLIFTPYSEKVHYGFGWYINESEINGKKEIFPGHAGGSSGSRSAIIRGVHQDIVVIYLSNSDKFIELRYPILDYVYQEK